VPTRSPSCARWHHDNDEDDYGTRPHWMVEEAGEEEEEDYDCDGAPRWSSLLVSLAFGLGFCVMWCRSCHRAQRRKAATAAVAARRQGAVTLMRRESRANLGLAPLPVVVGAATEATVVAAAIPIAHAAPVVPAAPVPPPQQQYPPAAGPVAASLDNFAGTASPVQTVDIRRFADVAPGVARPVVPMAPAAAVPVPTGAAGGGLVAGRVVGGVVPPPHAALPRVASRRRSSRGVRATRSGQRVVAGIRSARAFASVERGAHHRGSVRRTLSLKEVVCGSCGYAFPPGSTSKFCGACGAPRPTASGNNDDNNNNNNNDTNFAANVSQHVRKDSHSHAAYMQRLQDEEVAGWDDLSRHADAERERMQQLVAERRSRGNSRRQNQTNQKKRNRKKKNRKKKTDNSIPEEEDGEGYMVM